LRGSDVPHNPIFFSYGILLLTSTEEKFILYLNKNNISSSIDSNYFRENKIEINDFIDESKFYQDLGKICIDYNVILDKKSCNYEIYEKIKNTQKSLNKTYLIEGNIIEYFKAIKNETELEGCYC
jgi:Xaa-Pro aminopeptidase